MSASIIPRSSRIGQDLCAAAGARVALIAGLPSTGKSLLFQQLTILAHEAGRTVHTLQWDDARRAFETAEWLRTYPEIDRLTHPGIRKAVGLWVRKGVFAWDQSHPAPEHLLAIELPVIGGRFIELLQAQQDATEPLLASRRVMTLASVPTNAVRQEIEAFRAQSSANPRNAEEEKDAPPHIVTGNWLEVRRLFNRWNGLANDDARDTRYDEKINRAVFERICRHRHTRILRVDQVFATARSAHERPVPVRKMQASAAEVAAAYAQMQALYPGDAARRATDEWAEG